MYLTDLSICDVIISYLPSYTSLYFCISSDISSYFSIYICQFAESETLIFLLN